MRFNETMVKFEQYLSASNYAEKSKKSIIFQTTKFVKYCGKVYQLQSVKEITGKEIIYFFYYIRGLKKGKKEKKYAEGTIERLASSLSVYFDFLYNNDIILEDLASFIPRKKRPWSLPKDILSQKEIEKICGVIPKNTIIGIRDRLLVEILYNTGMRIGEALNLKMQDIDLEHETIFVRGKGRKDRVLPITGYLKKYIKKYLSGARVFLRKAYDPGYLVLSARGGSPRASSLHLRISRYGKQADLKKPLHFHRFRHAFSVHLMQRGCDIKYISMLLGHSRLETTQIYTEVENRDLRKKLEKYHFFSKRGGNFSGKIV